MNHLQINIGEILQLLSRAQSVLSKTVGRHQLQVAYLSYQLSNQLNYSDTFKSEVCLAALVHDIGALSIQEKLELIEQNVEFVHTHGLRGAFLLENFAPLKFAAEYIKYHHFPWCNGENKLPDGSQVPLASSILNLADSVAIQFSYESNILSQVPRVMENIVAQKGSVFMPEHVDAMLELSKRECIWLDLASSDPVSKLPIWLMKVIPLTWDDVIDLSRILSYIIDFNSEFTSRHSAGVAKVAERLARLVGFSPMECKQILVAGYLHDIGKLAIDNRILEKPGALNEEERNAMRSHTYYTYHLLNPVKEFENIKYWAAYHHERPNGTGYPFHISGEDLSLGSRIMAVADTFTAITEDRPYRKGMNTEQVTTILQNEAKKNNLDPHLVNLLLSSYDMFNEIREYHQIEAGNEYAKFVHIDAKKVDPMELYGKTGADFTY